MADDFSKGVVAQKEESDILVKKIETQTAELDTVVSKVTKMSTELDSVTADVKTNKEKLADLRSMIAGSESTVKNIAEESRTNFSNPITIIRSYTHLCSLILANWRVKSSR